MNEMNVFCPHCRVSFAVEFPGRVSNLVAFNCPNCKRPLLYFYGEICELDEKEGENLMKLLKEIKPLLLRKEESGIVKEKIMEFKQSLNADKEQSPITEAFLNELQKNLDEMDIDEFINSL